MPASFSRILSKRNRRKASQRECLPAGKAVGAAAQSAGYGSRNGPVGIDDDIEIAFGFHDRNAGCQFEAHRAPGPQARLRSFQRSLRVSKA